MEHKQGFLLGKFFPYHVGHKMLIISALEHCEQLTVLVCSLPMESIDGSFRYNAVKEDFKDYPNVTVKYYSDIIPQEPSEDVFFWKKWIPVINSMCPNIDIVFASEDYAKNIAENLGSNVAYKIIDKYRENVNISGTEVRKNPMSNYNYIAPTMRWYFNKKIAIMGCESAGKSTMTEKLANFYRTSFAPEYGRTHCETHPILNESDFIEIVEKQNILIGEANKNAYKLMFTDTEAITTNVFLPMYCNKVSSITEKYIEQYIINQKIDIYFVLKADNIPFQDGTRNFLDDRNKHEENIIAQLIKYNKKYVIVDGSYDAKFLKIVNVCNKLIM